jgi:hypothetical protein
MYLCANRLLNITYLFLFMPLSSIKQCFLLAVIAVQPLSLLLWSQGTGFNPTTLANVSLPPSPDAAAIAEYFDTPVSRYSGIPEISIPLFTLPGRSLSTAVALSYHAGGIRVNEVASRAGLGWSLVAGGSVSRTVHGLPDESASGFLAYGQQVQGLLTVQAGATVPYSQLSISQASLVDGIAKGMIDGLPDGFWVSAPGLSGKILFDANGQPSIIPHQKVEISVDWSQKTWTIRDAQGTRYTFGGTGAVELANSDSDCGGQALVGFPTSWMLTRMEDKNGDQINFSYDAENNVAAQHIQTEYTSIVAAGQNQGCGSGGTHLCETSIAYGLLRPKKITSAQGSIEFRYDASTRADLSGSHRLSGVDLLDLTGGLIRRYDLSHRYWSGRLVLDAVTESENGLSKPPYTFQYQEGIPLPPVGSKSQDHWGFSNGKPNTTLIPNVYTGSCVQTSFGNRNPDFQYGKSGLIRAITFPGGGQTAFIFEAHDYHAGAQGFEEINGSAQVQANCAGPGANCGPGSTTTDTAHFQLSHAQCIAISISMSNPYQASADCEALIRIRNATNNSIVQEFNCPAAFWPSRLDLPSGSYILEAHTTVGGDLANAQVQYTRRLPQANPILGGARIQSIRTLDGIDPANTQTQEFSYRLPTNAAQSSGVLLRNLQYSHPIRSLIFLGQGDPSGANSSSIAQCDQLIIQSNGTGLSGTDEQHVSYAWVQTLNGVGGSKGRTISHFSTSQDDGEALAPAPYSSFSRYAHRRGRLLEEQVQDAQGKKISEVQMAYSFRSENRKDIWGFQTGYFQNSPLFGDSATLYHWIPTPFLVEWMHTSRCTTRTYDENGIDYIEQIENYEYGNPAHAQLTAYRITDSHGRELIQRLRYPMDYAVGTGDAQASAITNMRTSAHLHALPIEQIYTEKDAGGIEKVLSAQLIHYQTFGNKVLPVKSLLLEANQPLSNFQASAINGTFSHDARYVERETIEAYNQYGQILRVRQKNGIHASFQWGYNSTLPVMQVLNASIPYTDAPTQAVVDGDASYNGFESGHTTALSPDNQFWEYNSATTVENTPYAGRKCIRIAPGNPQYGPLRQLRPGDQNQRFVFSAWVKVAAGGSAQLVLHTKADQDANGPVFPATAQAPAAYSSITIPSTGGIWKYFEAWIDLEKVRQQGNVAANTPLRLVAYVMNQNSSTPVFVDEMRIQPEMARLTTATYKPLVGLLSSSDANDYTSTFEYDGLQRLHLVRDHEGNILRRLAYQYKGQSGAQHNVLSEELAQQAVSTETQLNNLAIGAKFRNMAYFDGLGRPLQQVQVGFFGGTGDLITWVDHDEFGRIPKAWLPYVRPNNQGNYVAQPAAEQTAFYQAHSRTRPQAACWSRAHPARPGSPAMAIP